MNDKIRSLNADRLLPLQQLAQIRFYYATDILNTPEELESQSIRTEQATDKIENAESIINQDWEAYLKTTLTDKEEALVREAKLLKIKADQAIALYKQKIGNPANVTDEKTDDEMFATVKPLVTVINQLADLQISTSNEISRINESLYRSNQRKMALLIIGSIFIACVLGIFIIRDNKLYILNLKKANQKIKETEEKCRAFIKYAGDSILILDPDLRIKEVNDSACNLFGYSADELKERTLSDLLEKSDHEDLSDKVLHIEKVGGSLHERKFMRKDGSLVETEVNVRILENVGYISIIRNITERLISEKKIRESEEKYRYLFENSPAYIMIWDLETLDILEVNNTVVRKYGYSREEWDRMNALQYRPASDHEAIRIFAKEMLHGDKDISRRTWKHIKKNGEEMIMDISSHKITYRGRSAILSLANDITDQFKAEMALRKSEESFRSLIDHAADAIFLISDAGYIFDVNLSATELLQFSREEFNGKSVPELHPPEAREGLPELWNRLRTEKSYTDERKLLRKDGTLVDVEISRRMLPDGSGAIAIVRDITERKLTEERLKQSEANYRDLFELSPAPKLVIDEATSRFTQVNKACIDNYGYSAEEFRNMSLNDLYPEHERSSHFESLYSTSTFLGRRHIKKSGEIIDVVTSSIPILMNGRKEVLMIAIDVTEKNQYEQKLTRAAIKAQEDERYEIGGELHDNVCQILATSLMYLSLIRKDLPPQTIEMYDQVHQFINLASSEIRNLSHQLAPAFFEDATIEDAFRNLLNSFNAEKKYDISLFIEKEVMELTVNRELMLNLYRILQEQLRNISKYAKATMINISVSLHNQRLSMSITDNGVGFDTSVKKSGIGLANMNRRAQLFAGTFSIESSIGNGCEVIVEVPV